MLNRLNKEEVEALISNQPEGKNTTFLKNSHSLWVRFKNYTERDAPISLAENGKTVALVYATYRRHGYMNLYDIVTMEGCEGKGYGSKIYKECIEWANREGCTRLKMSCTPSSVTWHMRNGLVFWAVDPTGSLRSDQPLASSVEEQIQMRENLFVHNPSTALPANPKIIERLVAEGPEAHGFGKVKMARVNEAIEKVGKYWLRPHLLSSKVGTLADFFQE